MIELQSWLFYIADLSFNGDDKKESKRRISMISGLTDLSLSDDDDDAFDDIDLL